MSNTLTLKKLVLRDRKAHIMLSPRMYGQRGPASEEEIRSGLVDKWPDLKTGEAISPDFKHPYILVWTARHNGFDYRLAVSYNWIIQHFNINLTEEEFSKKLRERAGYLDQPVLAFTEHLDEEYFGMRLPLNKNEFTFNGETFHYNRYANNGMGDWLMFPNVAGKPDISNPILVDGVDVDTFYSCLSRFSYTVDAENGDIIGTSAEARTYDN